MTEEEGTAELIIEALEMYMNQILYLRDIYPPQIFKKRRAYNAPIFVSIFPPLTSYLHNVLRTARELHQHGELRNVQLLFYQGESQLTIEHYTFHLDKWNEEASVGLLESEDLPFAQHPDDEFLLDFEEQLRTSLFKMAERIKTLDKLPAGTRFKVLLHATQTGFIRLTLNPHYQDFPWLHETLGGQTKKRDLSILPLTCINKVGLKLVAEVF